MCSNHLRKAKGLVKHLLGLLALPSLLARRSQIHKVETAPAPSARLDTSRTLRGCGRASSPQSAAPLIGSRPGSVSFHLASPGY